jgi:hypothetical protein
MTEAPVVYRGSQATKRFLESLEEEEAKIKDNLSRPAPMDMTDVDVRAHNAAQDCHVCRQPLNDHWHITGRYRRAAHNSCNRKLRLSANKTPIPLSSII